MGLLVGSVGKFVGFFVGGGGAGGGGLPPPPPPEELELSLLHNPQHAPHLPESPRKMGGCVPGKSRSHCLIELVNNCEQRLCKSIQMADTYFTVLVYHSGFAGFSSPHGSWSRKLTLRATILRWLSSAYALGLHWWACQVKSIRVSGPNTQDS